MRFAQRALSIKNLLLGAQNQMVAAELRHDADFTRMVQPRNDREGSPTTQRQPTPDDSGWGSLGSWLGGSGSNSGQGVGQGLYDAFSALATGVGEALGVTADDRGATGTHDHARGVGSAGQTVASARQPGQRASLGVPASAPVASRANHLPRDKKDD